MTDADVQRIVAHAADRGRKVDEFDASIFLGAKEILEREPENSHALAVVENFSHFIATGEKRCSFDEFLLPIPYTDEELAEQRG